ncbi:MAG: hypothetical protein ABUJ98_08770 [Hyphomicrobium sp.]
METRRYRPPDIESLIVAIGLVWLIAYASYADFNLGAFLLGSVLAFVILMAIGLIRHGERHEKRSQRGLDDE